MVFRKSVVNYFLLISLGLRPLSIGAEEQNPALQLSVEDLLNVQVTSAAKKAQSLNDAPAAIFVISNEDIKRSGAASLPDAFFTRNILLNGFMASYAKSTGKAGHE